MASCFKPANQSRAHWIIHKLTKNGKTAPFILEPNHRVQMGVWNHICALFTLSKLTYHLYRTSENNSKYWINALNGISLLLSKEKDGSPYGSPEMAQICLERHRVLLTCIKITLGFSLLYICHPLLFFRQRQCGKAFLSVSQQSYFIYSCRERLKPGDRTGDGWRQITGDRCHLILMTFIIKSPFGRERIK